MNVYLLFCFVIFCLSCLSRVNFCLFFLSFFSLFAVLGVSVRLFVYLVCVLISVVAWHTLFWYVASTSHSFGICPPCRFSHHLSFFALSSPRLSYLLYSAVGIRERRIFLREGAGEERFHVFGIWGPSDPSAVITPSWCCCHFVWLEHSFT